jgi:hypothetical protein
VRTAVLVALAAAPADAQDLRQPLESELVFRIPGNDTDLGAELGRIAGATFVDRDLYLADASFHRIQQYSAAGALVRSQGREGSGPGEFRMLEWIGACAPDRVLTYDLTARRFMVFDAALRHRQSFQVSGTPFALSCNGGMIAYLTLKRDAAPVNAPHWFADAELYTMAIDGSGRERRSIVPAGDLVSLGGAWMQSPAGRQTSTIVDDDRVIVATGGSGGLRKIALRAVPEDTIPFASRPVTLGEDEMRGMAEDFLGRIGAAAVVRSVAADLLAAPKPRVDVHYRRAIAGASGEIWVQRSFRGQRGFVVDVLGPSGQSQGLIMLDKSGDLLAVGSDRFALLVRAESGDHVVEVYRVVR